MMLKRNDHPSLSKKAKIIWLFILSFVVIGVVVEKEIKKYRFENDYETVTSDPIDTLSVPDREYVKWFKTTSSKMKSEEGKAMIALACLPDSDCKKNFDDSFHKMAALSKEIVHAPEPEEPQLLAIQEEYIKALPLIGTLWGVKIAYETEIAKYVLDEEENDKMHEQMDHLDNAITMMDEYLESLGN
jgi:hypothetical protein